MKDITKFSFAEMCNNETGKTSMSAIMGGFIILCSGIGFLIGCITKNSEILSTSAIYVSAGAALLGVRKLMNNKENTSSDDTDTK